MSSEFENIRKTKEATEGLVTPQMRAKDRAAINAQVEEFLSSGGRIKQLGAVEIKPLPLRRETIPVFKRKTTGQKLAEKKMELDKKIMRAETDIKAKKDGNRQSPAMRIFWENWWRLKKGECFLLGLGYWAGNDMSARSSIRSSIRHKYDGITSLARIVRFRKKGNFLEVTKLSGELNK